MKMPRFDFREMLKAVQTNPIDGIKRARAAFRALKLGYHAELHNLLATCYKFAKKLENDSVSKATFLSDEFWSTRKYKLDQSNILGLATLYMMEAKENTRDYKYGMGYAKGLRPAYDLNIEPEEIPNWIKQRGGIEKLRKANSSKAKASHKQGEAAVTDEISLSPKSKRAESEKARSHLRLVEPTDAHDHAEDLSETVTGPSKKIKNDFRVVAKAMSRAESLKQEWRESRPDEIGIEANDDQRAMILNSKVGEAFMLEIKHVAGESPWVRLVLNTVKVMPNKRH